MHYAPANNTDPTGHGSTAEISAVVFALARRLDEAAVREWVAMHDAATEGISHDQAEQDPTVIDCA